MANHKSAAKRSRQTFQKTKINQVVLSRVKTTYNKLISEISNKNPKTAQESMQLFNSALSKALKKRIIKKGNASRKLSSLSNKLKKIT
tara:strand:- start:1713 stop:1976 length:264 start_codon:yes stop_codon:yes gene_type:complete